MISMFVIFNIFDNNYHNKNHNKNREYFIRLLR